MSIFGANISLLNKFLKHFSSCFSNKQMVMFTLAIYALFKDYKRNSLDAMAKATHTDYQKFQYFFSDSTWDIQALKCKRLEIIQKQRTTAFTKDGLLAIDDTGCPKPFAKKTEGAKWQYCGPLKREEVCNVGVGIAFVSPAKLFPLDIIPYLPSNEFPGGESNPLFKDKIQIAKELFDKSLETLSFSAVTFDSWYAATHFLEHIHTRKKAFFSEIKSNRNIFMHHPTKKTRCCVKSDVLSYSRRIVTLIKKHYPHKTKSIKLNTADGSEVSYRTYSFEAKRKDCDIPLKFVVILGKWNKDDENTCHILITNQLTASAKTVITNYLLRWGIEQCFRELKDTFYFDHYQLRHIEKIERYWNLVRLSSRRSLSYCMDSCLLDQTKCVSQ
ncbi:MAG: IS701 family transposase [Planctomycetia bacterium]|nr:MAG: IS701 family transposase [Planctomycetia bacterium]